MPSESRRGAFVDQAHVHFVAGNGGRGSSSFRREPFIPQGGPDGGDGGRGGSIVLTAVHEVSSLHAFASRSQWQAGHGQAGGGVLKSGRNGEELRLSVPVGTVVFDDDTGEVIADLDQPGAEVAVARGGAGGRGNIHFKGPVRQAPGFSEPGLPGEDVRARLELKLIADIGVIGPPNAGKSSLLRAMTAATPKVGDYPFTTLDPELGVTELESGNRLVMADIPGLIEGAAQGVGLGHRFLRHVERTRVLLYLVDGAGPDPWGALEAVRAEVRAYSRELAERPSLVAVNKLDLPETRELRERSADASAIWVSARTGEGLPELLAGLGELVAASPPPQRLEPAPRRIRIRAQAGAPEIVRRGWGFEVKGPAIERLVQRVDFNSDEGWEWFQVQLDRLGVSSALAKAGATAGDTVRVGAREFEYQP